MRTLRGYRPFADPTNAEPLWRSLRRAFPDALAACLMPNHLHLLDETSDPRRDRERLVRVAAASTRRIGARRLWEPAPSPEPIAPDKLLRQIRYLHLNPPRAGLVDDPLAYRCSTHRGVVGAEHEPWVPAQRIARLTGRPVCGLAESFHDYVSSDPSVSPSGSPFPERAPTRPFAVVPLAAIIAAAHSAAFWCPRSVERHATVLLGVDQGWPVARIADALGIDPRSVRRFAQRANPALLDSARLCLGDPRLCADSSIRSAMPPRMSGKRAFARP